MFLQIHVGIPLLRLATFVGQATNSFFVFTCETHSDAEFKYKNIIHFPLDVAADER